MPEFLSILPFLIAPVVALLFLNLRLSRKLRYPHHLLVHDARRASASFLLRSLRGYYDFFIDLAIAIILAAAISTALHPPFPPSSAVVLDCSRSMLAGATGSRPLDLALKSLLGTGTYKGSKAFALAFDPQAMRTRLVPLEKLTAGLDPARAAIALTTELDFFSLDYAVLGELRERGFGRITLLTDSLPGGAEGLDLVETGFAVGLAAYPTAVRYDRAADSWLVALAESGPREAIQVAEWNGAESAFFPARATRYAIEEGPGGRSLRFPSAGLYLLSIRGGNGEQGIDLPIRLPAKNPPVAASGPFSQLMLKAFPLVDTGKAPGILLEDLGSGPRGARAPEARIVTALLRTEAEGLLDPASTGGRPVAAGIAKGADLAIGPAGLANEDLVLAYDAAILGSADPPFATAVPPGTRSLLRVGSAYLALTRSGPFPLIAPPSESFEARGGPALVLPPPRQSRLPWALALALLCAAKLALWKRFSGKSLLQA